MLLCFVVVVAIFIIIINILLLLLIIMILLLLIIINILLLLLLVIIIIIIQNSSLSWFPSIPCLSALSPVATVVHEGKERDGKMGWTYEAFTPEETNDLGTEGEVRGFAAS